MSFLGGRNSIALGIQGLISAGTNIGATVPGAPTIGTATATGATTATVSFTQPASNGGSTITSYTATSSPGGITGVLVQAGSGTITVTGLTSGTAYTFTVTATNAAGTSAPSAASNSITTNYAIAKSLRFRASASAYLNRTFTTPTNNKIWTWSAWVKRGLESTVSGNDRILFSASSLTAVGSLLFNGASDTLRYLDYNGAAFVSDLNSSAVYKDFSAWYHIMLVVDTTSATATLTGTATDRIRMYVNGAQLASFATPVVPAQNYNTYINSAISHELGEDARIAVSVYFDGELAEVNFVDGQALLPASFGATGANSQWLPKAYTGTYGTNGFYLPFTNTTSTSTLVADSSGNGNNWTPNNISLTAGVTYDSLTDVPTLTSATVANYAVLNPLQNGAGTLSDGNLNMLGASAAWGTRLGTIAVTSGKWYFEVTPTSGSATQGTMFGITQNAAPATYIGADSNGYSYSGFSGNKFNNSVSTAYGATVADNDVVGVAFDADAGSITFYKNNVSQGVAFSGLSAGTWFLGISCYGTQTASINFGQRPFTYTAPTGFLPLNTFNI